MPNPNEPCPRCGLINDHRYPCTDDINAAVVADEGEYVIYIPEEGHWPIPGRHVSVKDARDAYLRWAERSRLPSGASITRKPCTDQQPTPVKPTPAELLLKDMLMKRRFNSRVDAETQLILEGFREAHGRWINNSLQATVVSNEGTGEFIIGFHLFV